MHFGIGKSRTCCVAHAVQQARHVRHHERDTQLNFFCNVYKVMIAVIRFDKRINFICELNNK